MIAVLKCRLGIHTWEERDRQDRMVRTINAKGKVKTCEIPGPGLTRACLVCGRREERMDTCGRLPWKYHPATEDVVAAGGKVLP